MMRIAATSVVAALLCAACATSPDLVVRKGKVADDVYLVTWRATNQTSKWCDQADAAGCERISVIPIPGGAVRVTSIVITRDHEMIHHIAAHEVCHAVAGAQGMTADPCHGDDGGRLPLRIDPR